MIFIVLLPLGLRNNVITFRYTVHIEGRFGAQAIFLLKIKILSFIPILKTVLTTAIQKHLRHGRVA